MSGGKYFEYILVYFDLDIGISRKKYFRSQDINLAPQRASGIMVLKSSFDSKRDAAGDNASSGYSNISFPTVNMALNVFDFSGR